MLKLACVAALCLVGSAYGSDVITATDATFDEVISAPFVLMEFYAPWCGHCKTLAPEWEKAATALKGVAVVAKLDATVKGQDKLAEKYEVKGYPTIKIFRDGKLAGDYDDQPTAEAIIKYTTLNAGPAMTDIESADQLEALKVNRTIVVVGFELADDAVFTAVAKKLQSKFTFVTAKVVEGEAANSIVVFKQFDDARAVFEGEATVEVLTTFLDEAGMRIFGEISADNYKLYIDRKLPLAWLFTIPGTIPGEAAKDLIEKIAMDYKGKISFVWVDAAKLSGMAHALGMKGDKFPFFALDKQATEQGPGAPIAFDEYPVAFEAEAVAKFVADFAEGLLTRTAKAEAEPAEHTVDGLTTVVSTTFGALVTNADKPVLLEFYAPWCSRCKTLAPTFARVAKAAADADVIIAKIDATSNDYPKNFHLKGFPNLFWIKKGEYPQPFELGAPFLGDKAFEGFAKFLKDKADITIVEPNEDL